MPLCGPFLAGFGSHLALAKAMILIASAGLQDLINLIHLHGPSPSALVQLLKMCSRVPRLEHNGKQVILLCPRYADLMYLAYTACMRNLML